MAGIVVGVATVAAITLTHSTIATLFPGLPEALRDLNVGIVALVLNVVATVAVGGGDKAGGGGAGVTDNLSRFAGETCPWHLPRGLTVTRQGALVADCAVRSGGQRPGQRPPPKPAPSGLRRSRGTA